jgi:TatD DNase family protein
MWTDTHAHLDAPEFQPPPGCDAAAWQRQMRDRCRAAGVGVSVVPAVCAGNFGTVRQLAHLTRNAYALGIHPLFVPHMQNDDLLLLDEQLTLHRDDPHLVAVGEIGLDFFVPALCTPAMRERQQAVYRAQLKLAKKHQLPVLLHVRKSADLLLKHLREVWGLPSGQALPPGCAGIAHAFNGSQAQADAFVALGFRLGFGGAVTFDAAHQLRRLAANLPSHTMVLETDAPDIPPQWLYATAAQRAAGQPQGINTPAELPRIGAVVAGLRGIPPAELATQTMANALAALPKLRQVVNLSGPQAPLPAPDASPRA